MYICNMLRKEQIEKKNKLRKVKLIQKNIKELKAINPNGKNEPIVKKLIAKWENKLKNSEYK